MSVGGIDLSNYAGNQVVSEQFDNASGEDNVQNKMVSVSGTYVMKVSTLCFRNKKNNNALIISPTLAPSSKKGVNLVASLEVVDGTTQVAKGDYLTVNIPVLPKPGATADEVEKMYRLSKPRMCALLGVDNFKLTTEFLTENFTTEWDEDDKGKFTLKKDHGLKGKVVCVLDDDVYNGKPTLNLVSMRRFKEGDVSISNVAPAQAPQQGFGSSQSEVTDGGQGDLDFAAAGDAAATPPAQQQQVTPEVVEEDSLPF